MRLAPLLVLLVACGGKEKPAAAVTDPCAAKSHCFSEQITPDGTAHCRAWLAGVCGTPIADMLRCIYAHQVCTADGYTDEDASSRSCQSEVQALAICCQTDPKPPACIEIAGGE